MNKRTSKSKKAVILIAALVLSYVAYSAVRLPLLKWAYGIHEPRIENEASLRATAIKYRLNPGTMVSVAPAAYRGLFDQFQHGIPEAILFDSKGREIRYKKTDSDCNAGLFAFIPALQRNHAYAAGHTILANTLSSLRDLRGQPLPASFIDPAADYYLLISWTAFSGKLNKDHVRAWQELAVHNHQARIQVIEVNFDIQEWWPKTAKETLMRKWM